MRHLALAVLLAGCVKQYPVRVELTPAAADRRLATGKSDTIDGVLEGSDGTSLILRSNGELQTVPRADIARVDQRAAKRDVTYGTVFAIAGGALAIGGVVAFDCGQNEFPLFCSLSSERNLYASLAMIGGLGLAGAGLKALFTGKAALRRTEDMLRGQRVGLVPVRDGLGIGVLGRF